MSHVTVVRTEHNSSPHERPGIVGRALLTLLERRVVRSITMSTPTRSACGRRSMIPHGHYRDAYPRDEGVAVDVGRLLYFGTIRGYKRVPELCAAFAATSGDPLELRVAGRPSTAELAHRVTAAAAGDERITTRLGELTPAELSAEIAATELVVLPFDDFENSGSALLALSLDRPVLVPGSPSSAALRSEVGEAWVHTFSPPLKSEDLMEALRDVRRLRPAVARVEFAGRDWTEVGRQHAEVYRVAVAAIGAARG